MGSSSKMEVGQMKIKGTAFLGRKVFIVKVFGVETWANLLKEIAGRNPFFEREIMPITLIEEDDFLEFNDFIVKKLYGGNKEIYWTFGDESAKWALTEGPLKAFMASNKIEHFIGTVSHLWKSYYNEGQAGVKNIGANLYDVEISGVELRHVYYEYTTFGFLKTGLILSGAKKVKLDCVRGFSKGQRDILYKVSISL